MSSSNSSDSESSPELKPELLRQPSVPAAQFLEEKGAICYKRGDLDACYFSSAKTFQRKIAGSQRKYKHYVFRLTAKEIKGYRGETDHEKPSKKFKTPLEHIKSISLLSRGSFHGDDNGKDSEYGFCIELKEEHGGSCWVLRATTREDTWKWVVAIDSLLSNLVSNSFNTFIEPPTDKKLLLKSLYKDPFKGGIVKSGDEEEWQYEADGTLTCLQFKEGVTTDIMATGELISTRSLVFRWDGELLLPAKFHGEEEEVADTRRNSDPSSSNSTTTTSSAPEDNVSLGAGQWSGVFISWYTSEWHVLKTKGRRDKFMKFFFDEQESSFIPENRGISRWKSSRHFLASTLNQGEWIIEGEVPLPVVMFLQLLRSCRQHARTIRRNLATSTSTTSVGDQSPSASPISSRSVSSENIKSLGSSLGSSSDIF